MKKNRIWIVLPLLASVVALLIVLAPGASAANTVASGTTGNLTWALDDKGTLTISGAGAMGDFEPGKQPWTAHEEDIIKVVIGNGITRIGAYAFFSCANLTNVTIPDSVTGIGGGAFWFCNQLPLEDGVYYADRWAVNETDCETVVLRKGTVGVADAAFSNCYTLTNIVFPNSVRIIGERAFSQCYGLTSITIPDSVCNIGNRAFSSCEKLYEVFNYSSLTVQPGSSEHGDLARYAKVVVDAKGRKTFKDDTNFTYLDTAAGYRFMYYKGEYSLVSYTGTATDITLPANFQGSKYRINSYAFSGNRSLTSVVIPDDITDIGTDVFLSCRNLSNVVLPDEITEIGDDSFWFCYALRSITIPESVMRIGSCSFNQSGLTTITIPANVYQIESAAFHRCNNLTSVIFLGDAPEIQGDSAFEGVTAYVYYPANNDTWTADVMRDYGGNLTWVPYQICKSSHAYNVNLVEPSCTQMGGVAITCTDCGYRNKTNVVDALGHSFGNWKQSKAATCTDTGAERRDCSRCDLYEIRDVAATGHSYNAVPTAPTCTTTGYTTHTCRKCKDSYKSNYTDSLSHAWNSGVVTTEPSEDTEGVRTYTCTRCQNTRRESIPKSDHIHSFGDWRTVTSATLTKGGIQERSCKSCDYTETEILAPITDYQANATSDWTVLIGILLCAVVACCVIGLIYISICISLRWKKLTGSVSTRVTEGAGPTTNECSQAKAAQEAKPQNTIYAFTPAPPQRLCPCCDGENKNDAKHCIICGCELS